MKYSYEYKKQCVELYRQGKWPETPVGVKQKNFHKTIRKWARMEEACGPEVLHHKSQNKVWTAEEKYELVARVLVGEEMIRLRAENERLRAEIAVVKKRDCLEAQLKAKKLRSSRNSAKKDTD